MHAPNRFGDDLTQFRYSIRTTNATQTSIHGLEMGKLDSGFRFVYPLFDDNSNHIGSVEVSIAVEDFLKKLEDSFHAKVNFLLNKQLVDITAFKKSVDNIYIPTEISPKFYQLKKDMGEYNGLKIPRAQFNTINEKLIHEEAFSTYLKNKDGDYNIITFLPIKNAQGDKTIAYIVKYMKNDYISELQNDYYVVLSLLLIILSGILFYAYKDYKYKQNLSLSFETIRQQKEELAHSVEELERQNIQIAASIEENRKKDTMIAEQSRLASLGEMIGNIAHQWRQPLSAISTSASSLIVQNELGILNQKELPPILEKIIEKTHFLSQTIEDFRNFIEGKKEKVEFVVSSAVDNALNVVDSSISNHYVTVKKNYQDIIFITNYKNEFIQAILNIINNAKDALDEKYEKEERFIFITVKRVKNNAIIIFQDNAGGIPSDIITKVFEPYFTTKHQSQGTGLGLYMTYKIITESMKGSIKVENKEFTHQEQNYFGARFTIELPIDEIKNEANNV
jgi:signal transduction histidine kinase